MQVTVILAVALHVLTGVFWAGSTFTLARTDGVLAERLFKPQMGAAVVAIAAGIVLWYLLHRGDPGPMEYVLAFGAGSALLAAGVQGVSCGPAIRKLASADQAHALQLRKRMAMGQRIAAGLLAITVVCMAAARYV